MNGILEGNGRETKMISHINIGITDFNRAYTFYSAILAELGLQLKFCDAQKPWAGWVSSTAPRPLFLISQPFDGRVAAPGNGQMVALLASNRETVDRTYAQALSEGGICEGKPGWRPQYHEHYYGAYFRDLDGNKICVCCHEAEG